MMSHHRKQMVCKQIICKQVIWKQKNCGIIHIIPIIQMRMRAMRPTCSNKRVEINSPAS